MSRSSRSRCIFIGNLPLDFRNRDLEDLFSKYGRISNVDVKVRPSRSGQFAFVEYEDPRDAEDAVRGRDGYDVDGHRLRVEVTRGSGPRGLGGRPLSEMGRGDHGDRRSHDTPMARRRGYPVQVTGLPRSSSWQDLKDHMRTAGDIAFADVNRDGTGVVEFVHEDDVKYAIRKFDDSKFTSHGGETGYIRLREGGPSYSRPPRRDYDRSRHRSPRPRSRSRSRTRSIRRESPGRSSPPRRSPPAGRSSPPRRSSPPGRASRSASRDPPPRQSQSRSRSRSRSHSQ